MEANNNAMREAILGNNAAIRKAMNVADETANELLSWCSNHYQELNRMGGRLKRALESAAVAPWRNCDRFGGDIDKLREACARERGINPEEDFPEVFAEWLLAPLTERGKEKPMEASNVKAMREALVQCELFLGNVSRHGHQTLNPGDKCTACDGVDELRGMVVRALTDQLRNCDIGHDGGAVQKV